MTNIKWLSEIGKEDNSQVGTKAGSIGELIKMRFDSPNGFVITTQVYEDFIKDKKERIMNILRQVDINKKEELGSAHDRISNMFLSSGIQKRIREDIEEAYNNLMVSNEAKEAGGKALEMIKAGREKPDVAVRSSVPNTNSTTTFAGIHKNFLNVKGTDSLLERIKKVWLSLFTPQAIYYREKRSVPHDLKIAVIVQRMEDMDKSGRAITFNPVNGREEIIIESVKGNGKKLGEGNVIPDLLIFDKRTGQTKNKVNTNGGLNENETGSIFKCVKKIDENFPKPQEIEWGLKRGKLYLFQSRSLTSNNRTIDEKSPEEEPLLEGVGTSPGNAKGKVINFSDNIEDGSVIFTRKLFPELTMKMDRINGVLSENGGISSSMSHIAREMGLPMVVADGISSKIKMNRQIILNSMRGKVYQRKGEFTQINEQFTGYKKNKDFSPTATEIKLVSESVESIQPKNNLDGIIIKNGGSELGFRNYDYGKGSKIKELSKEIYPAELWIESSPSDDRISTIKNLHYNGIDNLHVLFSSIKTMKDFSKLRKGGNFNSLPSSVKRGISIKTPAIALEIEKLCEKGIDFVSIDMEDLTKYTTGGSEVNVNNSSVNNLIEKIVECCNKYKVHSSIFLNSTNRDIVGKMVQIGVESISTTEDYLNYIGKEIERSERRMLLEKARRDG
ncbi:MAG: PEP/pyruvate-binding domain-containing protein [Candidatus Aenigmatarchaeota archaeon]